jgi:hypothetical protein
MPDGPHRLGDPFQNSKQKQMSKQKQARTQPVAMRTAVAGCMTSGSFRPAVNLLVGREGECRLRR